MRKKSVYKRAVALKYDANKDSSPRITAKGYGFLAEKIIKVAKEHNITLYDDPDLIEILSQLDINTSIPPEAYKIVAEIFSFVYKVNKKF